MSQILQEFWSVCMHYMLSIAWIYLLDFPQLAEMVNQAVTLVPTASLANLSLHALEKCLEFVRREKGFGSAVGSSVSESLFLCSYGVMCELRILQ